MYSDEKILYMIEDNEDAYKMFLEKYSSLINHICNKFFLIARKYGYEFDDLLQIASLAVVKAVRNYDANVKVTFYTYLRHCIKWDLLNEMNMYLAKKRNFNGHTFSYSSYTYDENIFEDKNNFDPFLSLIISEIEIEYTNFINRLPLNTAAIFEMRNSGCTYKEISELLEIDVLKVERTFFRVSKIFKNRIKKLLE